MCFVTSLHCMNMRDVPVSANCMCCSPQRESFVHQAVKLSSCEAPESAALSQDVPLSEMDKAAVLTLIREEVRHSFIHWNKRGSSVKLKHGYLCLFISFCKPCFPFFINRLSLKRLRLMSGRENMRRAEWRLWKWGRSLVLYSQFALYLQNIRIKTYKNISRSKN